MTTPVRPSQFWDHTRDLSLPHHRRKVDALKDSISQHGYRPDWVDLPIRAGFHDGAPWIGEGHHRLKALQELGLDDPIPMHIPVPTRTAAAEEDWRAQHRPPDPDDDVGAPLHEIDKVMPDFHEHPEWYTHGEPGAADSVAAARKARGNPDAKVRIYRSLPAEHAHKGFGPGDWVSTSKDYARGHGMQSDPKHDWPVIRTTVRAGDLWTHGDAVGEFGYHGAPRPGMVSFKGGHHQEVRQHADGVIRPVQRRQGALSDEALVSVAEHAMEQSGHAGRTWHVPKMHADDPKRREAHQPVHDFVRGVLAQHGYEHAQGIHVSPSHYDLQTPGAGQAMVNGMGTIGLKGEHTNDMTLLHECAHILSRTPEGPGGHGPEFQQTAHRLYYDHISPAAADTFNGIVHALPREAARALPHQRVFGPTFGLDKRLWEPSGALKPDVRRFLLRKVGSFLTERYGPGWEHWARIYFAGSEASMWTGPELIGNNDFDTLIGINYPRMRKAVPALAHLSNATITDMINYALRENLRDPEEKIEIDGVQTGPWDATFFVNKDSWNIRDIRPYAAYDVGADAWVVKPPDLPNWSLGEFPKTVLAALKAAERYARDVLKLPEPQRTQQGGALFDAWHSDRSRAFSPHGHGWYDFGNLREKWLDQQGVWGQLVDAKHRDDQGLGMVPDWSNTPTWGKAAVLAVTDKWPPYLKERTDALGDTYPVNESRANPRGPVMSEPDAKAAGYVGPFWHGTNKRRAGDIRRGGFRQPRMHNWEMEGAGNAEEVDLGHTHRTFFAKDHDDALHFARSHHGDDADVVKAYLHPEHMTEEEGGGWIPSVQVKDVAHAVAIQEGRKTAVGPSRLERAWGSHDENTLFGDGPTAPVPWAGAGRRKDRKDYDPSLVHGVITSPEHHHMQDVDPRELRATQPSITRGGVRHYLSGHYDRTGETFADQHNPGNRRPVVYRREDGQHLLLSGHHRAAAALLQGKPLQALVVDGPWGESRR